MTSKIKTQTPIVIYISISCTARILPNNMWNKSVELFATPIRITPSAKKELKVIPMAVSLLIIEFPLIKVIDVYKRQDLVEAKAKLEETIAEIDKEVKERFLETFVQVAENFNKIFIKLFKGGYADMTLETPNDILNTGIIIEASPPGKKLQNLSLLSGGEKSLTAISLLFAILQVKNPPFVVLDEVEAALDEENVNRFAKFLKLYSEDNQFLVITHRRGTMEAMDTLYGVTMQEKGISYILELELKDMIKNFEEVIE